MSITSIEITQDNVDNLSPVVACHSPLVYLAQATHDGTAPDELAATVYYDNNGDLALSFDGSTGYMYSGIFGSELPEAFSIACWVKLDDITSTAVIVSNLNDTDITGCELKVVNGYLNFTFSDGSSLQSVTHDTVMTADAWHFVSAVYDGSGNVSLKVDADTYAEDTNALVVSSDSFVIGRRRSAETYYFNGDMDNLLFYSRVLNNAELVYMYQNKAILYVSTLECGYNFNYGYGVGSTNTATDLVDITNNHLGTPGGTLTWEEGVLFEDSENTDTYEFRCIPMRDVSDTVREFSFRADKVLKFLLGDLDDTIEQTEETTDFIDSLCTRLRIAFHDVDEEYTTGPSCSATITNAARQWGENPNMSDLIGSTETQTVFVPKNFFTYLYGYNPGLGNSHTLYKESTLMIDENLEDLGFYRYKTSKITAGVGYIFAIAGTSRGVLVKMYNDCTNAKVLKFLDSNGQYRFVSFSSDYEENTSPESIGSIDKTITGLLTDMSDSSNIGYKSNHTLRLIQNLDEDQLEYIKDLYDSPRVYLYNNDLDSEETEISDTAADWTEVTIESSNPLRRIANKTGEVEITVTLPEHYSQTML